MSIPGAILDEVRKRAEKEKVKEGKLAYWLECQLKQWRLLNAPEN